MKGCRALSPSEIEAVRGTFTGSNRLRNIALFLLGLKTGFRISELLSLRIGDVFEHGKIPPIIYVQRRNMKKKREGRGVPLINPEARQALEDWLSATGTTEPEKFLFQSRNGVNKPLDRRSAWDVLKKAYASCGLAGKLATHTMRKTFARDMKQALGGDIQALQKAMGHAQITSTMSYLEVDDEKIQAAFRKI